MLCALSNHPDPAAGKGELIAVGSHHGRSLATGHWTCNWSMPGRVMQLGGMGKPARAPTIEERRQRATIFVYRISG